MIATLDRYSLPRFRDITLNDALMGGAVLAVLYAEFLRQFLPSAAAGLLQHGIVLGVFAALSCKKLLRGQLGQPELWMTLLALGLYGLSAMGSHSRGPTVDATSTILLIKFAYVACIASAFGVEKLARLVPVLAALQVIGLLINLALPGLIAQMIPQVYGWLDRSDVTGLQLNVNRFGIMAAVLFTWFCFVRPNAPLAVLMLICLVLSASRSGALLLVLMVSYFAVRGSSKRVTLVLVWIALACFPIGYLLREHIATGLEFLRQSLLVETAYIRTIMLMHGGQLALQNFPLGTGGGTFGSPLSLGSPIYAEVGIAHLPTVQLGHGINDSGVGSILGEYGLLGFALVMGCVAQLSKNIAPGRLSAADVTFLLVAFVLGSLFRAMISSYYYATIMVLLVVMLVLHRPKARASAGGQP